ncbi:hypothetical protein [Arthrobacter sp. HY1533]|uniref:hypothetical protein n=1 Tax=Arthrobacter sp. HY1533 TaxID=2970919 RepID=UPI0022B9E6D0|nr:hypothetical protein [Arthrobacter sp. HY1533]
MPGPGAAQLLEVWGNGLGQDPVRRALVLLSAAVPDTEPDVLADWPLGRRDSELLAFRASLFGPGLEAIAQCPGCGMEVELAFTVGELAGTPQDRHAAPLTVHLDGYEATLRPVTSRDLLAMDPGNTEAALTARCITTVTEAGAPVEPGTLPPDVLATLGEELGRADPAAATELNVQCPGCGHGWLAPFHIASYLWNELHHWARRLLIDVHTLARAYGWSEQDILALPPLRRQAYLELVGS